ncbi:MAG: hypothetical protein ABSG16_22120 [Candidatus Acidiferrum sp.]
MSQSVFFLVSVQVGSLHQAFEPSPDLPPAESDYRQLTDYEGVAVSPRKYMDSSLFLELSETPLTEQLCDLLRVLLLVFPA